MEGWVENRNARPENVFRDSIQVTKYQHHFRARPWTMEILQEMNLDASFRVFQDRFQDAGDFSFFFVGNFDLEDFSKQLKQMNKMGGVTGIMSMLPGISKAQKLMANNNISDDQMMWDSIDNQSIEKEKLRKIINNAFNENIDNFVHLQ